MEVRAKAVNTLGRLCRKLNFSEYASRIIQPLVRVMECMWLRRLCFCADSFERKQARSYPNLTACLTKGASASGRVLLSLHFLSSFFHRPTKT